jgi:hypothetical protein
MSRNINTNSNINTNLKITSNMHIKIPNKKSITNENKTDSPVSNSEKNSKKKSSKKVLPEVGTPNSYKTSSFGRNKSHFSKKLKNYNLTLNTLNSSRSITNKNYLIEKPFPLLMLLTNKTVPNNSKNFMKNLISDNSMQIGVSGGSIINGAGGISRELKLISSHVQTESNIYNLELEKKRIKCSKSSNNNSYLPSPEKEIHLASPGQRTNFFNYKTETRNSSKDINCNSNTNMNTTNGNSLFITGTSCSKKNFKGFTFYETEEKKFYTTTTNTNNNNEKNIIESPTCMNTLYFQKKNLLLKSPNKKIKICVNPEENYARFAYKYTQIRDNEASIRKIKNHVNQIHKKESITDKLLGPPLIHVIRTGDGFKYPQGGTGNNFGSHCLSGYTTPKYSTMYSGFYKI